MNLFIDLIKRGYQAINHCDYFFNSEDYFINIISSKTDLDKLIKKRHLPKTKAKTNIKIRKCIR